MIKELCKVCQKEVVKIDLSKEQKYFLFGVIHQDLKLFAKHKLCSNFDLDETEAQIIIEHLNTIYGQCINCEYDKLKNENIECPNCGKYNYNLSDPYINKELSSHPDWCSTFCSHLEWSLAFDKLDDESVHSFWCDGISVFETKEILTRGEVETKAWIGKDGQGIYKMKIIFGEQSVLNFKSGESLIGCIPTTHPNHWVFIDPDSNKITVKLN